MNLPINKNKSWISLLLKSISKLDEKRQAAIMKPCGQGCASDMLALCEKFLGKKVNSIEDLIIGWNMVRDKRGLIGRWEYEPNAVRGIFKECGCPLVRSGLIELHPVQCYCSQGMMEAIFSEAAHKPVEVEIKQTIGRGDAACHFFVKLP
jgi:predicted hydrocarbon binding protein